MRKEGIAIPDATVIRYSNLSDKHEILEQMQKNQPAADPTLEAKARLLNAQADKTVTETAAKAVEAQFSAIQTAQVITQTPATAGLADSLLRSAGYVDKDAAPIVPEAPAGAMPGLDMPTNTNPLTPLNPEQPMSAAEGMTAGIETAAADS
jgi:hypothetical protein